MMMTQTIWKYPLKVVDRQVLSMPAGAQLLCVQDQGGAPTLWALVSPDVPLADRTVLCHGTGHSAAADVGRYIGTTQQYSGALVWHFFEANHDRG
jgi:hypothetical protein